MSAYVNYIKSDVMLLWSYLAEIMPVPLCVQRPAKTMPFQQMIMRALQCQHGIDVHLLFRLTYIVSVCNKG